MARSTEARLQGQLLLLRGGGKAGQALFQVGVVLLNAELLGNGHHNPAEVKALEPGCRRIGTPDGPIEIEHGRPSSRAQQPPQLPQAGGGIGQVAQAVGDHGPIPTSTRQSSCHGIALLPAQLQPGL